MRAGATALLLVALVCWPTDARAGSGTTGNMERLGWIMGGIYVGTGLAIFGSADVYYAAKKSWLPGGWAGLQTLWGVLNLGTSVGCFAALGYEDVSRDAAIGTGIAFAVLGSWYLVHGILSLIKYRPPRYVAPRRRAAGDDPGRSPAIAVAPLRGGAYGSLRWSF